MAKVNMESLSGQTLLVGIDAHKKSFHVTLCTFDRNGVRLASLQKWVFFKF